MRQFDFISQTGSAFDLCLVVLPVLMAYFGAHHHVVDLC